MQETPQKVALIPPDVNQCQAQKKEGAWPDAGHFMVIGPRRLVQCTNKPEFIITEKTPGPDGQYGSMSVCGDCYVVFCHLDDPSRINIQTVEDYKRQQNLKQKKQQD